MAAVRARSREKRRFENVNSPLNSRINPTRNRMMLIPSAFLNNTSRWIISRPRANLWVYFLDNPTEKEHYGYRASPSRSNAPRDAYSEQPRHLGAGADGSRHQGAGWPDLH